jgi:hypothetical protein
MGTKKKKHFGIERMLWMRGNGVTGLPIRVCAHHALFLAFCYSASAAAAAKWNHSIVRQYSLEPQSFVSWRISLVPNFLLFLMPPNLIDI